MTDVITVHIKAKYGRVPSLDSLVILSRRTIQTQTKWTLNCVAEMWRYLGARINKKKNPGRIYYTLTDC